MTETIDYFIQDGFGMWVAKVITLSLLVLVVGVTMKYCEECVSQIVRVFRRK